jgi:hypothetical protein
MLEYTLDNIESNYMELEITSYRLQEVAQSAGTTHNEIEVFSSNHPFPLLCGHVKKKNYKLSNKLTLFSYLTLANMTFEKSYCCKILLCKYDI